MQASTPVTEEAPKPPPVSQSSPKKEEKPEVPLALAKQSSPPAAQPAPARVRRKVTIDEYKKRMSTTQDEAKGCAHHSIVL